MKKIKLTQNKFALVDNNIFDFLNQWKWRYTYGRAVRTIYLGSGHKNRKAITIHMHRLINNTPKGFDTDHIDRNPLNNQKSNLRTSTHSDNLHNRGKQKNSTSGHKGVYRDSKTGKWRVQIQVKNKVFSIGRYKDIKKAIFARQQAEKIYYEAI